MNRDLIRKSIGKTTTFFHIQKSGTHGARFPTVRYEFRFSRRFKVGASEIRGVI